MRDLVTLTALGIAKAPSMAAAGILNEFLSGILQPENDLFVRATACVRGGIYGG